MMSRGKTIGLIVLLLFFHLVLRQRISYVDGSTGQVIAPDFILLSVIFAGLGRGVIWGVVGGFLLGVVQDSFVPVFFGVNAFVKVIVGFVSGRIGTRMFLHTLPVVFLIIVALKYMNDILVTVHAYLLGQGGLVPRLLFYSPGSSLYTAACGLAVLTVLKFAGPEITEPK